MLSINIVSRQRTLILGALVAGAVALVAPRPAEAHFHLDAPPAWMSQTANGDPQKTGPCGDEAGGTPTGTVTRINPQPDGTTRVTILWHDTVPHPGHYRIALSVNSRTELPAEPVVTPTTADQCASAAVASAPYVLPILADNVNPHTSGAVQGNQMVTVTIPASVSCTHCTLQVLEFMSSHGAPCFYHHCADIAVGAISGSGGTSGGTGGAGGRTVGTGGTTGTGGARGGNSGATGGQGMVAGTGGASATGGAEMVSGGTTGSTGGTTASTGGTSASGGAVGTGGSTVAGSGGRSSPDAATTNDPGSTGCGCRIADSGFQVTGLWAMAVLGLGLMRRRRKRA